MVRVVTICPSYWVTLTYRTFQFTFHSHCSLANSVQTLIVLKEELYCYLLSAFTELTCGVQKLARHAGWHGIPSGASWWWWSLLSVLHIELSWLTQQFNKQLAAIEFDRNIRTVIVVLILNVFAMECQENWDTSMKPEKIEYNWIRSLLNKFKIWQHQAISMFVILLRRTVRKMKKMENDKMPGR